jgi:PhzF family phenazine biosynthesis protein
LSERTRACSQRTLLQKRGVRVPYFQVDAFTDRLFGGNPAGICLLEEWLPDALLQGIATENNLSETAFLVPKGSDFDLRWFTPEVEIDLCGHATLAAAFVIFHELKLRGSTVRFHTRSGVLSADRAEEVITLDFPALPAATCTAPAALINGLGWMPIEVRCGVEDLLAVVTSEADVLSLKPDTAQLAALDARGIIVTAPGSDCDFVSRFFAPRLGIVEDPVTGSAHSTLIPYWSERLGKTRMLARQLSSRGGELFCEARGDRVGIGGRAVLYSRSQLELP